MVALASNIEENAIETEVCVSDFPPPGELCATGNYASPDARTMWCEVVSDFDRLEQLSPHWKRLWKSDPQAEIFQTPEWAIAWWRSFGQGSALCSLVVFAADEIVGILPLLKRDGVIQFLGTPEADYADMVCEEQWAAEVLVVALKTLRESITGWRECVLQHLSKDSRVLRHYRSLPRQLRDGFHCVPTERYQTIVFRNKRDAVLSSLMGKNHSRRRKNKLQKAGQVRFRHLQTQQEAETYLNDFFRHHVRRHAVIGRRSAFAGPKSRQFVRTLIERLGPAVRFGVLELDGRPLAWHFGFEVNGKFLLYQHTFDLDASDYTPGELLLWNLFEYAKDHVAREFDFGSGDEPYKSRFANHSRETFCLFLEPPRLAGRMRGLGRAIQGQVQPSLQRMKQVVKSHPAILRGFRSLRMWSSGTAARFRQANERGVLLQYGLSLVKELLRDTIWSTRSIEVFASEMLRSSDEELLVAAGSPDLEVSAAGFGDLVDLATQHPEVLLPSELGLCRKRLKRGDQAYIARQKSRVVILCWISNSTVSADASAQSRDAKRNAPLMAMDECWSAEGEISASYRQLLSVLICAAGRKNAGLLIHCDSDQPVLRSELERLGFLPSFRIVRHRFLGWFRRDAVLVPLQKAARLSQAV